MKDKIIKILRNLFLDQADCLINRAAKEISALLEGEGDDNDEIDLSNPDYRHDCVKCGNSFWNKTKDDNTCESCKSSINLQPVSLPDKGLIAKSGKKYRSIPDDVDLETWDNMTVVERLHYKNLIITNNKDAIIQKQDEIIEHLSGMSPDICAECRRLETELENLKKQ